MNPSHKLYWLIGGVVALLIVASVIGRILRARVKDEKAAAVVDNLIARVRAWWWMVAVFAAAFLLGRNATIAMFAFISFYALREFLTLTPTKIGDHRALSVAFFVLIPIQYVLIATNWYGLFSIFIPVYGFLFLPSISVLAHDTDSFLERSATLIGAAMWWITPFTPLQSAGMAFIIVLMGFLGGLVLSAVKRSLGAKDWGSMIEGHGGVMDRMDSVSFAAPIFFHATRYFFT
jgi:predicted CDP-diglyceride synthetase/phosphatidate cytidylyltransferase